MTKSMYYGTHVNYRTNTETPVVVFLSGKNEHGIIIITAVYTRDWSKDLNWLRQENWGNEAIHLILPKKRKQTTILDF